MRSQDEFVAARRADWDELDRLVASPETFHRLDGPSISRAASLYRALCADVTRCKAGRYTPDLNGYLNGLAARAHGVLYGAPPFRMPSIVALFARDFPVALRKNRWFFLNACLLLFVPWAIGTAVAIVAPQLATRVLPAEQLDAMAHAYSGGFSGRGLPTNTGMAGFYVYNNVGIAFRCFATGVLFGLGSVFFLVYNGLVIGITTGYVMHAGYGANIWTFMCGHGPFEITAIVISGTAGLRMGYALVDTGGITRIASLRNSAPEIARLILGAALMLVIAALIEGFWSPSALPAPVKWAASGVFSTGVVLYLTYAGRAPARVGQQGGASS